VSLVFSKRTSDVANSESALTLEWQRQLLEQSLHIYQFLSGSRQESDIFMQSLEKLVAALQRLARAPEVCQHLKFSLKYQRQQRVVILRLARSEDDLFNLCQLNNWMSLRNCNHATLNFSSEEDAREQMNCTGDK